LVKFPTSSASVSPNRELEHTLTASFQGIVLKGRNAELDKVANYLNQPSKQVTILVIGLEPGVDILGINAGGTTQRAVLNLSATYYPDYAKVSASVKPHWRIDSKIGCFGPSQTTATSCSETLSVSHMWPSKLTLQFGSRIGLTPYDPRFGIVASLAWQGSLRKGAGK